MANTIFLGQYDQSTIPFIDYARECLSQSSDAGDNNATENHEGMVAGLEHMEASASKVLMDFEDQVSLLKTVNYLFKTNKKLNHESNILWWLFGQYSTTHAKYFAEVGVDQMILSAAVELAELNDSKDNLPAAKHFLHKALVISNDNKIITSKVKLSDVVTGSPSEVKTKILAEVSSISEFTPCLLALSLNTQFEEPAVWKAAVKSKLPQANIDSDFLPVDIAFQVYNEILFVSSLQD